MCKERDIEFTRGRRLFDDVYTWKIKNENITDGFKRHCRGFTHGGKTGYLLGILKSGKLSCSNVLRANCGTQIRDKTGRPNGKKDGSAEGAGVYFRFVRRKMSIENDIFHVATGGVGSTGGVFYFMPCENAAGKTITTMSSNDMKFGLKKPSSKDLEDIAKYVCRAQENKTEIAFETEISLDNICIIYINRKSYKSCDYNFYETMYEYGKCQEKRIDKKRGSISYGIDINSMHIVVVEALKEKGFDYITTVEKNISSLLGSKWDVFERKGSNLITRVQAPESPPTPGAPRPPEDDDIFKLTHPPVVRSN